MPVKQAMIKDVITVNPSDSVEAAWKKMEKTCYHTLPVVDKKGKYLGVFNTTLIVKKLLPNAATLPGGLSNLGFMQEAMNYSVSNWKKLKKLKVKEVMQDPDALTVLHPETAMLEALRLLQLERTTLPVVDTGSCKLVGILSLHQVLSIIEQKLADQKTSKKKDSKKTPLKKTGTKKSTSKK